MRLVRKDLKRAELPIRELLTASITSYDGSCTMSWPRPSGFHHPALQIAPTYPATSPPGLVLPCFDRARRWHSTPVAVYKSQAAVIPAVTMDVRYKRAMTAVHGWQLLLVLPL
jgi:hypothetical protein